MRVKIKSMKKRMTKPMTPTGEMLRESKKLFDEYDKALELKDITILPDHPMYIGDINCLPAPIIKIRLSIIFLVQGLAGAMEEADRHKLYQGYMYLDCFVETRRMEVLVKLYEVAKGTGEESGLAVRELMWQTRHLMNKQRVRELLDWEYYSDKNEKRYTETDVGKMTLVEFEAAMKKVIKHKLVEGLGEADVGDAGSAQVKQASKPLKSARKATNNKAKSKTK